VRYRWRGAYRKHHRASGRRRHAFTLTCPCNGTDACPAAGTKAEHRACRCGVEALIKPRPKRYASLSGPRSYRRPGDPDWVDTWVPHTEPEG
jgi:hypothetical protein